MDIVIVGAGEVGLYLADILTRESHRVSVVDSDPMKVRRLQETLDVQALEGDGTRPEVLASAGAAHADLFVAVTNDDRINMIAALMGRHLGAKRVIVRLRDTSRLEGYHFFHKRAIGYDVLLSTDDLATEEILGTVREHHALEVESFASGRVQLRRLRIRKAGELTSDVLAKLELPGGLLVAAISRRDQFFVASGSDRLEVDDQVYVIGKAGDLDQFEALSGAPRLGRRSVMIMGGGRIGVRLAEALGAMPGVSVRILERDPERAKLIAGRFGSSVMVLVGDATDIELLNEERISEVNTFIATSADDEDNIIACHLASTLGVGRTVAILDKAAYRKVFDSLHIDKAISPRLLCAKRILRFVRAASIASIAVIAEGRAEVLEIEARSFGGKNERKVKNLGMPSGIIIGAVVHGEEVVVPRGDTIVRSGDRLILFTLPERLEALNQFLGESGSFGTVATAEVE
ncbi:MAG: Trk system potassium transporter TrkA [Planctomycetota bacterium]